MNNRLLKKLILKEIHSVLNEADNSKEEALLKLNSAVLNLEQVFSGDRKVESFVQVAENLMNYLESKYGIEIESDLNDEPDMYREPDFDTD